MKKYVMLAALLCCCSAVATAQTPKAPKSVTAVKPTAPRPLPEPEKYKFTDIKTVPATSIKNQARSGTCWCFSGIALIESEELRSSKDTLDLSEMWIVRNAYFDKAVRYARMHGRTNLDAGGVSEDVCYIMDRYGIVPESVYPGLNYGTEQHVHGEINAVIKAYMNAVIAAPDKTLSTAWQQGLNGILDAYFGKMPETFTVNGKQYTPKSWMQELKIDPQDYVNITSYTHHPFYRPFVLEIPDNWSAASSYNVPMEDFRAIIDYAIETGHGVNWASDVSEKGFAFDKGFAIVPVTDVEEMSGSDKARWTKLTPEELKKMAAPVGPMPEKTITQQMRQHAFDNYETTDDHGMLIVGTAKDQNGNPFYKVKNSWGERGEYKGYFYASVPFVLYKSTGILVRKDAIPAEIRTKLGL